MIEIRVQLIEYVANVMADARVRSFALSWDRDGNISRKFVYSSPEEVCHCCKKTTTIMLRFERSGWVCQRCLFTFLAEELHE